MWIFLEESGGLRRALAPIPFFLGVVGIVVMACLTTAGILPDNTGWWMLPIALVAIGLSLFWRSVF